MASPKVRLVRCPKCGNLLPEIADVPVYKCGGCNTILQAKNRKNDGKGKSNSPAQSNESLVTGYTQSSSSHREAIISYEEGSSSQSNGERKKESVGSNCEQLAVVESLNGEQNDKSRNSETLFRVEQSMEINGVCSSNEHENEELSPLAKADSEVDIVNRNNSDLISSVTGNQSVAATIASAPRHEYSSQERPDQSLKSSTGSLDHMEAADKVRSQESSPIKNPNVYESSSSHGEHNDQFPDENIRSSEDTYKNSRSSVSDERQRKDKSPMGSDSEMQESVIRSLRNESLEPMGNNCSIGNGRIVGRGEYHSRMPFYLRNSFSSAVSDGGIHGNDDLHRNSSLHLLEASEYARHDQLKLLGMLYEQQDQFNNARALNGHPGPATYYGIDKHVPPYYNNSEQPDGLFHDMHNPRYSGGLRNGAGWSQQARFTHVPKHECGSCVYSGQLRDPFFQNRGFNTVHPVHCCSNSYSSSYSSPQRYTDQEYYSRWSHEMRPNFYDQRHGHDAKKYLGERNGVVKRHIRPTAGGAPFLACHYCLQTLLLPADFLVIKSRIHLLKCGACSKTLRFSFRNRTHLAPIMPHEVYDTSANHNLASNSSEKGSATEEPVSYNSWDATEERSVSHSKQSQSKDENASRDVDGQPQGRGSPLHRLMGYSSVSQVFKKSELPVPETISSHIEKKGKAKS